MRTLSEIIRINGIPHILMADNMYRPIPRKSTFVPTRGQLHRNPIHDAIDPQGRGNVGHRLQRQSGLTDTVQWIESPEYARQLSAHARMIDARIASLPIQ